MTSQPSISSDPDFVSRLTRLMQSYAQAGFGLFPVTSNKIPMDDGWQQALPDLNPDPEQYPHGFGVAVPANVLILDYDVRRDPPRQQLRALFEELGIESPVDTFIVRTGGGGVHVYFALPRELQIDGFKFKVPGYDAIEVKSKGRYVIGAGSPHRSGREYTVERGELTALKMAPTNLIEKCRQTTQDRRSSIIIETNDEFTRQRFGRYCQSADPAIEGVGGDLRTFKTAAIGKEFGLTEEATFDVMLAVYNPRCTPPWEPDELRAKIANAYQYSRNGQGSDHPHNYFGEPDEIEDKQRQRRFHWDYDANGRTLKSNLNNVRNCFDLEFWRDRNPEDGTYSPEYPNPLLGLLRYNRFSQQIEFTRQAPWQEFQKKTWDDSDAMLAKAYLGEVKSLDPTVSVMHEAAVVVSRSAGNSYDPILEYLHGITWDGIPRIDRMLVDYAGAADSPYVREVSKNLMIGLVARAEDPGCKHDEMVILEGAQGIGKSTFVEILGGRWYADVKIDVSGTDAITKTIQNMQGAWVLEASELEFIRKSEINSLKRFLSVITDKVRLPYNRVSSELPRRSLFIGTFNPVEGEGYFRDETGNRRFLPVRCNRFDLEGLRRDRDQLFAEAVARYNWGEQHHSDDPELLQMIYIEQMARMEVDPWFEIVENWLLGGGEYVMLTTEAIAYNALQLSPSRIDARVRNRIAVIMRKLKYRNKPIRSAEDGRSIRQWIKSIDWI